MQVDGVAFMSKERYVKYVTRGVKQYAGMADHALFLYHAGIPYLDGREMLQTVSNKFHHKP